MNIDIVVVKKTFRYANVFFYNHLYHSFVFRNLFLKSGIAENKGTWPSSIDHDQCSEYQRNWSA
jgi:hypothetical protein